MPTAVSAPAPRQPAEAEVRYVAPGLVTLTPGVERVLGAIRSAGGRPLLVGGCVRDALLDPGSAPSDIDVEVYGTGVTAESLAAALSKVAVVNEVGRSFGVLKVKVGSDEVDVALPRREVKTAAGHRGFETTPDPTIAPRTAAERRDFTMNAVFFDPETEEVLDFHGGVADLEAGVLRHVSPAFAEDPLRVLRGVRFASRFGFTLAPETVELSRSISDTFTELPRERVWGELVKTVHGRRIDLAVDALEDTGWISHFPELADCRGVEQDPGWHPEGDVLTHLGLSGTRAAELADERGLTGDDRTVVVLGALVHDFGKVEHTQVTEDGRITSHGHDEGGVEPVKNFLRRNGAPEAVVDRILPIVREHMCSVMVKEPTATVVRRLARRLAPATITDWALVVEGDKGGRGPASTSGSTDEWVRLAQEHRVDEVLPKPLLRGEHLMALGHRPGPEFLPVMAASIEAQDEGVFTDTEGAQAWLANLDRTGRLAELLEEGARAAAEQREETLRKRKEQGLAAKAAAKAAKEARRAAERGLL